MAFPPGMPELGLVHVLDLAAEGKIKPHVDSVRVQSLITLIFYFITYFVIKYLQLIFLFLVLWRYYCWNKFVE